MTASWWICGLHILLFVPFALGLGRARTTPQGWLLLPLALAASACPGDEMVHNGSTGTAEKREGEGEPLAEGKKGAGRDVNMTEI